MAINILVTHSGGFHADELLSSVVLTRLFPEASLMRSRDELCITPATDKIIYDVGETMISKHRFSITIKVQAPCEIMVNRSVRLA